MSEILPDEEESDTTCRATGRGAIMMVTTCVSALGSLARVFSFENLEGISSARNNVYMRSLEGCISITVSQLLEDGISKVLNACRSVLA